MSAGRGKNELKIKLSNCKPHIRFFTPAELKIKVEETQELIANKLGFIQKELILIEGKKKKYSILKLTTDLDNEFLTLKIPFEEFSTHLNDCTIEYNNFHKLYNKYSFFFDTEFLGNSEKLIKPIQEKLDALIQFCDTECPNLYGGDRRPPGPS